MTPPHLTVPRLETGWDGAPDVPALVLADGSGAPVQRTEVRLRWDDWALHVRFSCTDRDIWGTHRRRDDPLWEEEVVEVFLAPGAMAPVRYFELEVSPHGTLFDALVENPRGERATMKVDPSWNCPGLAWGARISAQEDRWEAWLQIPWAGLLEAGEAPPRVWRANLFRIDRPKDGSPEFSCWSPIFRTPADFHRPECFGILELG